MKSQLVNQHLTVTFDGDVLSTHVDALRSDLSKILDGPAGKAPVWNHLELDLSHAKMMDSAGLNLITTVIKNAKAKNAQVTAKITSKTVQRIFIFTRLDKHINLVMQSA